MATKASTDGEVASAPKDKAKAKTGEVSAVGHAITIIKIIGISDVPLGVNEISRRVGLHKSTVSRLLSTLERHGFVERNGETGRFTLGIEFVALAGPLLSELDVVKVSRPTLRALANDSGETVYIAVWNGRDTIMIEQAMGERAVTHYARPGTAMPTHASAAGKLFMAYLPQAREVTLKQELQGYTDNTKIQSDQIERELQEIRSIGFSVNIGEYERESCGIAAPVFDVHGDLVGALTIAVPTHRFGPVQQRNLAVMIVRHAADLSRHLGYVPR